MSVSLEGVGVGVCVCVQSVSLLGLGLATSIYMGIAWRCALHVT